MYVQNAGGQNKELNTMINTNLQSQAFLFIMGIGALAFIIMLAGMQ
jgi:hypothetical protein